MPLQLNNPETVRPVSIHFNPEVPDEVAEAETRLSGYVSDGFRIDDKALLNRGQIRLLPPEKPPGISVMRILNQNGDDRVCWNRSNPDEVREAYAKYNELIAQGYTAYAVGSDGRKTHKIEDFDPSLEECILVPEGRRMPG